MLPLPKSNDWVSLTLGTFSFMFDSFRTCKSVHRGKPDYAHGLSEHPIHKLSLAQQVGWLKVLLKQYNNLYIYKVSQYFQHGNLCTKTKMLLLLIICSVQSDYVSDNQ